MAGKHHHVRKEAREAEPTPFAFTQTAHTLVPANPNNLMSTRPASEVAKRVVVPISAAMVTPAYVPVSTWTGGAPNTAPNTPVEHGSANVKVDTIGPNAPVGDYLPRTQADLATGPVTPADTTKAWAGPVVPSESVTGGQAITTLASFTQSVPINTPFGTIEPQDPYPKAGDAAPAAPTLASLTPNTAVVGQPSIIVKATGTGFTPYSVVEVGGTNYAPTTYVSPTELRFPVDTMKSVPGVISVKVLEHNLKTSAVNFTFT
jgi:hypothetical protein